MITLETLKTFCGEDETRAVLMEPFTIGEFTYATCGRMAVRVPAVLGLPVPDYPLPVESVEKAMRGYSDRETGWQPAPTEIPHTDCGKCYGTKQCECHCCDNVHPCGYCDGAGEIPDIMQIGAQKFNGKFIKKLLALPNCEVLPNDINAPIETPLSFRFDGGIGLLMGIRER